MARSKFARRPQTRPLVAKVLIGCEGAKTEPLYFNGIRQHLRRSTVDFVIVEPGGSDPKTIVSAVVERVAELERAHKWRRGDSAWAVFDGEEHWRTRGERHNWNDAIQLAEAREIRLAISNPCFELWYLLHFQARAAELDRDAALVALRAHMPKYEKNLPLFERLHREGGMQPAVERARGLAAMCGRAGWSRWRNPSTGVFRLVELLLGDDAPR